MTKKNRNKRNWQGEKPRKQERTTPAPIHVAEKEPALAGSGVAPLLLTVDQVAALLNISRATVYRLESSGQLPGKIKLGGQVRYHREVIEQWLLAQVSQSTNPQGNERSE